MREKKKRGLAILNKKFFGKVIDIIIDIIEIEEKMINLLKV